MRLSISLLLVFLVVGCRDASPAHVALGTWNNCTKDGNYEEFFITNEFMLIMSTRPNKFFLFQNNIDDNKLVISTIQGEINMPVPTDTLVPIEESKNKVVLRSNWSSEIIHLNEAKFDYAPIDWENLESWKKKMHAEFQKRAKLQVCQDLRSDDEKIIPEVNIEIQK